MKFKTIHSESIYQGRAFNVRKDQVELPNGKLSSLDIVDHPGAVTLIPVDEQGRIWFVRQYRYAAGRELLELPAGTLERDETPEHSASREVREETGMAAGKLRKIGDFFMAPGYSTEHMVVFLATDLRSDPLTRDEDEFLSIEQISIEKAYGMVDSGEMQDGKTLAALLLARPYLSETGKSIRTLE
ncbi:MAG: NUDIX hydrolase [Omnitrophica WOR_2 bacterium]